MKLLEFSLELARLHDINGLVTHQYPQYDERRNGQLGDEAKTPSGQPPILHETLQFCGEVP
jgi:hypothetical protein